MTLVSWLKAGQLLFGGVVGSGILDVCMGVCVVSHGNYEHVDKLIK